MGAFMAGVRSHMFRVTQKSH